jgi:tetratricopeptide (TPR) repeat protein
MFVGRVTWKLGPLAREVLAQHKGLDKDIPTMPAELGKLLAHCLEFQPARRPMTMLEVADELQTIYTNLFERPYPRELPRAALLLAGSLNNQALSLYDLGKVEEAKQLWERALATDPLHLETIYNYGLIRWRAGVLTDEALVQQLEAIRAVPEHHTQATVRLAQIHLERGDEAAARTLLEKSASQAPLNLEAANLLSQLRTRERKTKRDLCVDYAHTDRVTSVCLSADGRLALSGSADERMRLWEVESGRCLRTFERHTVPVNAVSLSADGRLALSGGDDKTLRLWEVESGRCLRTLEGQDWVSSVSLSADGRLALSGSNDGTLRLWVLDWELEAREAVDWDEGARSYLEAFLLQHTPSAGQLPQDRDPTEQEIRLALTRRGTPIWSEQDFEDLIHHLQRAGYGWLRPDGVRYKLEEMAQSPHQSPREAGRQIQLASWWSRLFRTR